MNEQDRQAIEGLFARLAQAEQQAGPRDAEADAFIKEQIGHQPGAPYMMAQTIVMQNFALEQAQQRIAELEEQAASQPQQSGGGVFGGFFGGGKAQTQPARSGSVPASGRQAVGRITPAGAIPPQQQGGGFLAGAAQTAMGVAGGVLLANAIGGMFGGTDAQAAPAPDASAAPAEAPAAQPDPVPAEPALEPAADEGSGFFDSIFGGGGDDFDI